MKYVAAFLLVRFSSLRAIHSYWDFLLLLGSLSLSLSLAVFSLRKRTREHIFARIRSDSRGGVFDRLGESLERERERKKRRAFARGLSFFTSFSSLERNERKKTSSFPPFSLEFSSNKETHMYPSLLLSFT